MYFEYRAYLTNAKLLTVSKWFNWLYFCWCQTTIILDCLPIYFSQTVIIIIIITIIIFHVYLVDYTLC